MINIDEFSASIADKGIIRTSKFSMMIPLPNGFLGDTFAGDALSYYHAIARDLPMWITSAQLPQMSAQVDQIRRFGYGPLTKVPVAPVYEDILINVMMDAHSEMWNFFYAWKELTITTNSVNGINGQGEKLEYPYDPYEIGYRDDYSTAINFTAYSDTGDVVNSIVLRDAYPVEVGSIKFDWADKNRIATFPVLLTYQDWYPENTLETAPINSDGSSAFTPQQWKQVPVTPPIQQLFSTTATRTIS